MGDGSMTDPLYKTTVIIWTEFDPSALELPALAAEADYGSAYCSKLITEHVKDPSYDLEWDGTDFFDLHIDDDEDMLDDVASVEYDSEHDDCPITLPHNHYVPTA